MKDLPVRIASSLRQQHQTRRMMLGGHIRLSWATILVIVGGAQLTLDYYATTPLVQPALAMSASPPTPALAPAVPTAFLGLDLGDWATWAGALFTFLSFAAVALGLYVENCNRKKDIAKVDDRQNKLDQRATYLLESEQARRVGAFISWPPDAMPLDDQDVVEMTVFNASDLPVQNVHGYIISVKDQRTISAEQIPIVHPGEQPQKRLYVERPVRSNDQRLVLVYNDDSGVRWRKYLDQVSPKKLEDHAPDLPWEQEFQAQSGKLPPPPSQ